MIDEAPSVLEDDDVLEMVNAGLAPITVVDDYLAEFWRQVFTNINVHKDVSVRSGGTWLWHFARTIPSCEKRSTSGSGSMERATASAMWSNGAISRTSST